MNSFALACLILAAPPADVETRDYRVSVDGKAAGRYTMTIAKQPDGTFVQTGNANVSVRILLRNYSYTYRGTETWKDGRLVKLESTANDDGKRFEVRAEAEASGLRLTVNGQTRTVPANVWTMSYWRLPADRRQGAIVRLDTDTGRVMTGIIQLIGKEVLNAGGRAVTAEHYRISGQSPAELWFDDADRLVRQETMEEGHKTILEWLPPRR